MIEKYESLPSWLRWLFFLPLSFFFTFLAIFLLSLLRSDFAFIHSAVAIVSFAVAVYIFAPRWGSQLVLASLILRMLFSIGMVSFIFIMGESPDRTTWFEIGRELFGWVLGWSLYFYMVRKR